jgi:hypothetical protein
MAGLNALGSRLAVLRPTDTTAATIFTASLNTEITKIFVANVTSGALTFRLFHGASGDSYDQDNALYYDVNVAANATMVLEGMSPNCGIMMQPDEILGVRSSAGNGLNFSVYGVTAPIAEQGNFRA